MAIALPVGGGRGHAIAVAVATVTVTRTAQDIRAALVPWFDASALPRRIVCVPSLPRESSGKLPRARVLARLGDVELSPMPIHVDVDSADFEVERD